MKKYLVISLLVATLLSPTRAWAENYGEGSYGDRLYGADFGGSSPSTPSPCSDTAPKSAPTITNTTAKSTSQVEITFTKANDPVTYYAAEYGTESGKYLYSSLNIGDKNSTRAIIGSLSADTTYYFRLRAGNGCATGEWSQELSAKTLARGAKSLLFTTNIEPEHVSTSEASPNPSSKPSNQTNEYNVTVSVIDEKSTAVKGAHVTIHSEPQDGITAEDGTVHFSHVNEGQHTLRIAYQDYEGEENILVNGDSTNIRVTVTIRQVQNSYPKSVFVVIGVVVIVIVLLVLTLRRKKQ